MHFEYWRIRSIDWYAMFIDTFSMKSRFTGALKQNVVGGELYVDLLSKFLFFGWFFVSHGIDREVSIKHDGWKTLLGAFDS